MNIILVCDGGASTGFMAHNMIRYAKSIGLDVNIEAIGESEIEDYIEEKDIILIAPHLKFMEREIKEKLGQYGVPYIFIPPEYYSKLDGEKTLKLAIDSIEKMKGE